MRVAVAVLVACAACGFRAPAENTGDDGAPADAEIDAPAIAIDAPASTIDAAPDAPDGSPCANGMRDGDEVDIDCGGSCPAACAKVFAPDGDTLALFELNGTLNDTSGNNRNATLIAGGFTQTPWGMGFAVNGSTTQGFQWSAYANLLVHPFTIEMVNGCTTTCYKKLFGGSDTADAGWYYCTQLTSYGSQQSVTKVGPNVSGGQRHYLAFVSTSTAMMDVYLNGAKVGAAPTRLANPPTAAIFFRDDTVTQRSEAVNAVIDAVRLSRVARTATEIAATQTKLATQP